MVRSSCSILHKIFVAVVDGSLLSTFLDISTSKFVYVYCHTFSVKHIGACSTTKDLAVYLEHPDLTGKGQVGLLFVAVFISSFKYVPRDIHHIRLILSTAKCSIQECSVRFLASGFEEGVSCFQEVGYTEASRYVFSYG